ncbi:DUF1330 domain-containing protein [Thalassospira marina]|uniref:DUF1330 domain-containing protein n=1 Tax=Thalassospira marina TaxID=2048283 RepID=A0ABM6QBC7_9PROT|nr:DUF1330 domain-containing protein [Thalassospira marina]AUG53522.1 hypothetical protein CSC3H3_12975 [Thalassospira marina]
MTAFVVLIREETTNPADLDQYREKAPLARDGHAITPVAFYGMQEVLEGPDFEGAAILRFPTMEEARARYHSPAYETARQYRQKGSISRVFIIEGIDAAPSS